MRLFLVFCIFFTVVACGPEFADAQLSADEVGITSAVGFDDATAELVRGHSESIARLQGYDDEWDARYGISLYGAGTDWLQAEFATPPADWGVFAAEVYEFCPDVVDQGTGSVKALSVELRKMNGVYLWWD